MGWGIRRQTSKRTSTPTSSSPGLQTVTVSAIKPASDRAVLIELRTADSQTDLAPFTAGAHIDLHVDARLVRQYSLVGSEHDTERYLICVQREEAGRGGSRAVHDRMRVGDVLTVSAPRNTFNLGPGVRRALLLAGGVGITPLTTIADRLHRDGVPFELHAYASSAEALPLRALLEASAYRSSVVPHYSRSGDSFRTQSPQALSAPDAGGVVCVCGPRGFIDEVRDRAVAAGWPEGAVLAELFTAHDADVTGSGFTVVAASTGQRMTVGDNESIAAVLERNGYETSRSCGQGYCGSCVTRVIQGVPDHRDDYQSEAEHAANTHINVCCSRSLTPELVLDL